MLSDGLLTYLPLTNIHRRKRFHGFINRFNTGQEIFQLRKRQCAWAIAFGLVGIGMGFKEQTGQSGCHTGKRQVQYLGATAARCCGTGFARLQGMGYVKNNGQVVTRFFHHAKAEHIDHQIVVAEVCAAFAQNDLLVACFLEFLHNVFHLRRAEELRLFDVDDIAGFRHCHHQIGLACQEGWQLDDIADFGNRLALVRLVNVGNHGNVKLAFHRLKNLHAFVQTHTAERVNGRAVCLVERGFEHIRDAEFIGYFNVLLTGFQRRVEVFKDIDAAEKGKGRIVADGDVVDLDIHGKAFQIS